MDFILGAKQSQTIIDKIAVWLIELIVSVITKLPTACLLFAAAGRSRVTPLKTRATALAPRHRPWTHQALQLIIPWFPGSHELPVFSCFFHGVFPSTNDEKKYHTWSQIGPIRDHADKIKLGSRFWWVFHSTRANRLRILVEKQELEALEIQYANMTM